MLLPSLPTDASTLLSSLLTPLELRPSDIIIGARPETATTVSGFVRLSVLFLCFTLLLSLLANRGLYRLQTAGRTFFTRLGVTRVRRAPITAPR